MSRQCDTSTLHNKCDPAQVQYNKNKYFLENSKDVGMAQKGQKQERISCGEVFAVCGFHLKWWLIIDQLIWYY